jgi:hypothetical protein
MPPRTPPPRTAGLSATTSPSLTSARRRARVIADNARDRWSTDPNVPVGRSTAGRRPSAPPYRADDAVEGSACGAHTVKLDRWRWVVWDPASTS